MAAAHVMHLVRLTLFAGMFLTMLDSRSAVGQEGYSAAPGNSVAISISPDELVRDRIPPSFLGFNLGWRNFQLGYWRDGRVLPEVIDYLSHFPGAVYRYPGGTDSNMFVWQEAIGSDNGRSPQGTLNMRQEVVARFGPREFLEFVKSVGGAPLFVLNLFGEKNSPWDPQTLAAQAEEVARLVTAAEGASLGRETGDRQICRPNHPCPVQWWQLGNELDHWGKTRWTSVRYAQRAELIADAVRRIDPSARFIVNLMTAPWARNSGRQEKPAQYDEQVAGLTRNLAPAYAFHAYYDGMSVPAMRKQIQRSIRSVRQTVGGKDVKVLVTEHGRWPKRRGETWKEVAHRTGNLSGALSSADFVLAMLQQPEVEMLLWHQLGTRGPWQLLRRNADTGEIYPNVVYWGLRVIHGGFLDELVRSVVESPNHSNYRGGYDIRAAVTRSADGAHYSILTVNRYGAPYSVEITMPLWAGRQLAFEQVYVSADSKGADNTDTQMHAVGLMERSSEIWFDDQGRGRLTLPPNSIVATVFAPDGKM